MPIHKTHAEEFYRNMQSELRSGIFGALEFLGNLRDKDDWSFVIKGQALVEAAVTEAVLAKVGTSELKATIERLPLADEQIGKLAIAKDLGLMPAEQRRFTRRLAELRNRLAHRVEYVNFSLAGHVASLEATELSEWKKSITWFAQDRESQEAWADAAVSKPRIALYMSICMVVWMLKIAAAKIPKWLDAAELRTAEELFASLVPHDGNA
jgi:hypothetical protein